MSVILDLFKLTSVPQKLILGGAAAALVASLGTCLYLGVDNRILTSHNAKLEARIDDPKTGYVVKLAQSQTNTATCATAIAEQNTAIQTQSNKDAQTIAGVQARYDTEHAKRVKAESAAAVILAHKPQGATVADRVQDVDAQILGDLK